MDQINIMFAQWLGANWVLGLATGAFWIAWPFYGKVLKTDGRDRNRLVDFLAKGGPRAFYIAAMTRLLDRVDVLLGDTGQGQRRVAQLFGMRKAHPCWTGASFDICALLAVVCPIMSLVATWLFAGDAGPVGELFGLSDEPDWRFRLAAGALMTFLVAPFASRIGTGRWNWVLGILGAVSLILALAVNFPFVSASFAAAVVAVIVAGAVAGAYTGAFAISVLYALALAVVVAIAITIAAAAGGATVAAVAVALSIVVVCLVIAIGSVGHRFARLAAVRRRLGVFWGVCWPVTLATLCLALWIGGRFANAPGVMSLILIVGLMPLVNLPFDWASIGMTRALLRRGCEDHGSWLLTSPTWLGLIDAIVGIALMTGLALTIVATLTAADAILLHAGGKPIFDAVGLIDRTAKHPSDPANGWVYVTLLATLLPSFFNLLVGVLSLLTFSVSPLRQWLITTIPIVHAPDLEGSRLVVGFALSAQVFLAVLLTGFGLSLVWQVILSVPGAEQTALHSLHAFAVWLGRCLGVVK